MSARLPTDKLEKAIKLVSETLTKNKLRLVELQSVIGYLNFASRVVVPGRAFVRRLINLSIGVVNQKHFVRINAQAKKDLQAWLSFLKQFNGGAFFLSEQWLPANTLHLHTDASGVLGYGAVFQKQWFYGKWPEAWDTECITSK